MIGRKYVKLPKEIVKSLFAFLLVLGICPSAFAQSRWVYVTDGAQTESGTSIAIMLDGGPVVSGYADSKDGDFIGLDKGSCDVVVNKLDKNGRVR